MIEALIGLGIIALLICCAWYEFKFFDRKLTERKFSATWSSILAIILVFIIPFGQVIGIYEFVREGVKS